MSNQGIKYKDISLLPVGEPSGDPGTMWWKLTLGFTADDDTGHLPSVSVLLPLKCDRETTLAELEKQSGDLSRAILREALSCVEEKELSSLIDDQMERDKLDREETDALMDLSSTE